MRDYSNWHTLKSVIDTKDNRILFKEGDIWWCTLGQNIGHEQDGKHDTYSRPVLVFRKFNTDMFWALPLTSKFKDNIFHYKIENHGSSVMLSQLRLISAKRLVRKILHVRDQELELIREKVIQLIRK